MSQTPTQSLYEVARQNLERTKRSGANLTEEQKRKYFFSNVARATVGRFRSTKVCHPNGTPCVGYEDIIKTASKTQQSAVVYIFNDRTNINIYGQVHNVKRLLETTAFLNYLSRITGIHVFIKPFKKPDSDKPETVYRPNSYGVIMDFSKPLSEVPKQAQANNQDDDDQEEEEEEDDENGDYE